MGANILEKSVDSEENIDKMGIENIMQWQGIHDYRRVYRRSLQVKGIRR
jgi:hypothetical protein